MLLNRIECNVCMSMLYVLSADKEDAGFISVINSVTPPVFTAKKVRQRERFITPFQGQPDRLSNSNRVPQASRFNDNLVFRL